MSRPAGSAARPSAASTTIRARSRSRRARASAAGKPASEPVGHRARRQVIVVEIVVLPRPVAGGEKVDEGEAKVPAFGGERAVVERSQTEKAVRLFRRKTERGRVGS